MVRKKVQEIIKPALIFTLVFSCANAYMSIGAWWVSGSVAYEKFFQEFVLTGTIAFLGFSAALALCRRAFPNKLSTLFFHGSWRDFRMPLGLAIVRGSLIAIALLGLETFFGIIGSETNLFWVDPWLYLDNAGADMPALHGLAQSIWMPFNVALLGVVLPTAFFYRWKDKLGILPLLTTGLWLSVGLGWGLSWMLPWGATTFFLFISGLLLSWVLLRYDLITLLCALFTFELGLIVYPTFVLYKNIKATDFYLVFALWFLLVLFGTWLIWNETLQKRIRKFASEYS